MYMYQIRFLLKLRVCADRKWGFLDPLTELVNEGKMTNKRE